MMRRMIVFFLVLCAGVTLPATASKKIHPLYLEDTRWTDYTHATWRDREGYLWIGTDEGLKRYDGYTFQSFTHNPDDPASISRGTIRTMLEQSDGTFWSAGYSLNRFHRDTGTFTVYPINNYLTITSIVEDAEGFFWVGGEGFGLLRFDPRAGVVTEKYFADRPEGNIWAITAQSGSTAIWIASRAGIYRFHPQTQAVENFSLPIDLATGLSAINSIAEDSDGQLWIGTLVGLFILDPATGEVKNFRNDSNTPQVLVDHSVTAVARDAQGQMWLGTDKEGAFQYQPERNSFIHYPPTSYDAYKLPRGAVTHIHEDDEGNLWFSLGHYGVYRLSPFLEKFTVEQHSFDSDNSLAFNNVLDLHEDRDGIIWIGTDGGGLNRFDPVNEEFRHYRHDPADPTSISSNTILAIAEDSNGFIWLGTWGGGLDRLDPRTGAVKNFKRDSRLSPHRALADNNIFRIEVDQQDRLLLSVWEIGLQIFDTRSNRFTLFTPAAAKPGGIRSNSINDFERTPAGDYWLGGYHGIELFSPATQTFFSPEFTLTSAILDLHLDEKNILWIATDKGLIRYNPVANVGQTFSKSHGLSSEYIVSIEQDDAGYLWLGTREGLNRFDPRTREVTVFDKHDGLAGPQFNRFSHLKSRSGRLYFGGTDGLTHFNPADLPNNHNAPQVHITGIEIGQRLQDPRQSPWIDSAINYVKTLTLPYHQRDITLHFSATNLISPTQNLYRYRLHGQEEEWTQTDGRHRRVRYNNLEPGEYRFQVLASNNEGVWSGSAKQLKIIILPAWWQTWWAKCLYLLLAVLFMYAFSYWRLRSNRHQQKQLELLVGEQTAKLKEANRAITQLNNELEQRVAHRTHELSQEIEERRESEAKANYIAYHDALTGLYNRAWLLKHLEYLIRDASFNRNNFALFFIGGDRFRKINDTYGHVYGDHLLVAVSQRLMELLPSGAHAVRLGSDEFTVILDEIESPSATKEFAEKIVAAFDTQFVIDQIPMHFNISLGYVISSTHHTEPAQVLRSANIAMQYAKENGGSNCQMFDEKLLQRTLDATALEADLKQALRRGQFRVVYQPIINISNGALNSYEVLLRWHHPERGFIPPDKFIPMAESLGLIFDIGLWVLEQACEQLQEWKETINPAVLPGIAVNLSPIQLERMDLLEKFEDIFEATGVDRRYIKFEITESALMKHTDTVDRMLESLRNRGIELAIDDFGTGYSSLSYLDKLPVQILKVDRSFVNGLTQSGGNTDSAHEIVRATISLAHNLKMRVVAEGIETAEQLQALNNYGCDYGQGYFIARPLTPEDATQFLIEGMNKSH